MGFNITGSSAAGDMQVDANNQAKVALNQDATKAGFAWLVSASDEGDYTTSPLLIAPETDADYRLRIGQDSKLFDEPWSGAAVNSGLWTSTLTTFTVAVANGFVKLNSGASTTGSAVARLNTYQTFSLEQASEAFAVMNVHLAAKSAHLVGANWAG